MDGACEIEYLSLQEWLIIFYNDFRSLAMKSSSGQKIGCVPVTPSPSPTSGVVRINYVVLHVLYNIATI